MPTELEELVGFIAHPNPQIRLAAAENLVPYSTAQPSIFKTGGLKPIKNLRVLVRDHPNIAQHVLTMLVNLSADNEVRDSLVQDEKFLELLFQRIVIQDEKNADLMAMLLANLAKSDSFCAILSQLKQPAPEKLGSDDLVLNQLTDLFVKGAANSYNQHADYDYLAYLFADLAKHPHFCKYLMTPQPLSVAGESVIPLSKLKVFTEHVSPIRRKGVASTIKNVAFDIPSHPALLNDDAIGILPYILLPLAGPEDYDDDEAANMLPDLQLLPPDKRRDSDPMILQTHLETLTLLTTTLHGRHVLRRIKAYPIIRETHLRVDDQGVMDACDRLVQVLMRDEAPQTLQSNRVEEIPPEEDDDDKIIQV
ncbi:hypothetical protein CDD81_2209 [Ophiocordyceps australis]|uniref:Protein HGH1 homolog n=1 Tax=Ophiocordyceps australis TaxID=1399860 RepID=A0A2C5XRW0_9HYPO|nr:hypothetical protein CDD81_2209 [Ophiocordyceps australis]